MKQDALAQFVKLRNSLLAERSQLAARLKTIDKVLSGLGASAAAPAPAGSPRRRRFSAETRRKMAAAQKARWAKRKAAEKAA